MDHTDCPDSDHIEYPNTPFQSFLARSLACDEGRAWVGSRTPEQFWEECQRGDWMEWLLDVGLGTSSKEIDEVVERYREECAPLCRKHDEAIATALSERDAAQNKAEVERDVALDQVMARGRGEVFEEKYAQERDRFFDRYTVESDQAERNLAAAVCGIGKRTDEELAPLMKKYADRLRGLVSAGAVAEGIAAVT
jgi:hypothetical protein